MHECRNVSVGHTGKSTAFGYVNEFWETAGKTKNPLPQNLTKSFNGNLGMVSISGAWHDSYQT